MHCLRRVSERGQPCRSASGATAAARLPAAVVEALGLKEGDEIRIEIAADCTLRVERDRTREEALESLRTLSRPLPPGFRFSRDEANERGGRDE